MILIVLIIVTSIVVIAYCLEHEKEWFIRNNQLSALPQMETSIQIQISSLERELHDLLTSKNTNLIEIKKLRKQIAELKDNQTKQPTLFTFNNTYRC